MAEEKDCLQFSPEILAQLAEFEKTNPKVAEKLREMFANMRQAHAAWKAGQYKSFNDAIEAITGQRPRRVEDDYE